jgi:hypothetical protein
MYSIYRLYTNIDTDFVVSTGSSFLSSYMSSHTDTLVAYVLYFGKIKETLSTAKMTSIDQVVSAFTCLLFSFSRFSNGSSV